VYFAMTSARTSG